MQPYFYPYAGYFRLFELADEFVIYDCVQFPRRGRVHRTQVPGRSEATEWLTLPLERQPRETRIMDLRFAPDARATFDERLAREGWLDRAVGRGSAAILDHLHAPLTDVVDYLESGLRVVCRLLGLSCQITRSSWLQLDPTVRGQDRILAVASARGAEVYLNAPGGMALYDVERFRQRDIELRFLTPYEGRFHLLLPAILETDPDEIAADVRATADLVAVADPS